MQDVFYHLMAKVEKTAVVPPVMECCDSNAVPVQYGMVMLFQMCCVIHCAISSLMHYMGFYSTLEETQINFQNEFQFLLIPLPPPPPTHPYPPSFIPTRMKVGVMREWSCIIVFLFCFLSTDSCPQKCRKQVENRLKTDQFHHLLFIHNYN